MVGEFVTLTGEMGCQDDSYQGESRYFATKIWQGNHLKDKYSWEKAMDSLSSPADCQF